MSGFPSIHDTLRLEIEEADSLLSELNERVATEAELALRKHDRHVYNIQEGLIACFEQPNSEWKKYRVRSRNLSCGGLSILHGVFVYPYTRCVVLLKRLDGKHEQVTGKVVEARCVKGRVHEIKICFEGLIEIENFVVEEKQSRTDGYEYQPHELLPVVDDLSKAIRNYAPLTEIRQILLQLETVIQKGEGVTPSATLVTTIETP